MPSQNKGYSQVSGSYKLHTAGHQEQVTTQLSCRGGVPSAYPTNTKFPSVNTVTQNHIYRGQMSTELQSKGARSLTIIKGASKIGRTSSSTGLK